MGSVSGRLSWLANAFAIAAIAAFAVRVEASTLPGATLRTGGAVIQVVFAEGNFDLPRNALLDHVMRAACAVSMYYGRFPVPRYRLLIVPMGGRPGVLTGTTWGFGGAHSRILVGEHATMAELDADWIVVHEMAHTAFPTMAPEHHWIEEGIATYVEPLSRSWIGDYPPLKVWSDLVLGLPKGMPAEDDEGLDRTHTWGRTYWGGAMFCVLADVEIRRRTNEKHGLIDALRGVLAASRGIESEWPIERALRDGDSAVGVPVLEELYARMRSTPISPDLPALWRQLGVKTKGDETALDDLAPEAPIRLAISARPANLSKGCGG